MQTTLYGQEKGHYENCNTSSGKNTKTSSPGEEADHNRAGAESSGSSPEKNQNEMSIDFDCSYDGDSDVRVSKLKSRRRNKKHRKDKKRSGSSPSPSKSKNHHRNKSPSMFDADEPLNDFSHESQADQAQRVAETISGKKYAMKTFKYQPLEKTRSDMSAAAREKLQANLAALLGGSKKKKC